MRKRLLGVALTAAIVATTLPAREAEAAPDPVIASLLSVSSTLLPIGITAGLFLTGRGVSEGIRFDIGMSTLAVGAIVGPSVGQIYGKGGVDALLTFLLRTITGGVMVTGVGIRLRGDEDLSQLGTSLAVLGGIPTLLLALWDFWGAATSAREARYEAGHGYRSAIDVPDDLRSVALCGAIPCSL